LLKAYKLLREFCGLFSFMTDPIILDRDDLKDICFILSILCDLINGKPCTPEEQHRLNYITKLSDEVLERIKRYK
jgi:hypothetical protein